MLDCWFEDVEVDEVFRSRGRTITETDVVLFAMVTRDWSDIHVDREFVKRTRFGRRIAHAGLTLGIALGLCRYSAAHVRRVADLRRMRFVAPVFIDDTVTVELRVTARVDVDETTGRVGLGFTVLNQDGRAVLEADCAALLGKRTPVMPETGSPGGAAGPPDATPPASLEPESALVASGPPGPPMRELADRFFDEIEVGSRYRYACILRIDQRHVDAYRDLCADYDDMWAAAFTPLDGSAPTGPDVVPGNLLYSMQYGVARRQRPMAGIIALYELESIRYLRPLRIGQPFTVETDVLETIPKSADAGTVRNRRTVHNAAGEPVMEIIAKESFRTRSAWERAQREVDRGGGPPWRQ
jgi:acyl dehydratase